MDKEKKLFLALTTIIASALFLPQIGFSGDLEPSAVPGPTMKTLDQIPPTWSQILPVAERFVLVMNDEAVLDKETGLVWVKSPSQEGRGKTWSEAIDYCFNVEVGGRKGWRLPALEQLMSLVDTSGGGSFGSNPKLPNGHPFWPVPYWGWSATTYAADNSQAWLAYLKEGTTYLSAKNASGMMNYQAWCVRGGQGHDAR